MRRTKQNTVYPVAGKAKQNTGRLILTEADSVALQTLACKIRVATPSQLARAVWNSNEGYAYRRLVLLARTGFLQLLRVRACELDLTEPLWIWKPGDPLPPVERLSYQARVRWKEGPRPTTVFVASERLARLYAGVGGRLSRPLQVTHDLHVSAIYLRLLREQPNEARLWVSDSVLAQVRRGQKLPDAELQDAHGRTLKVIEFAGSYPPERLQRVHDDCARRNVPYEIW